MAISGRKLGPENPQTLKFMDGLAIALGRQTHFAESVTEYRQLLDLERRNLGADHPDTLATMHNLANVLSEPSKYDETEKYVGKLCRLSSVFLDLSIRIQRMR